MRGCSLLFQKRCLTFPEGADVIRKFCCIFAAYHDTPPTNLAIIIHPAWSIALGLETELAVAVDIASRDTVTHLVGNVRTRREITKPCRYNCRRGGQKSINAPR